MALPKVSFSIPKMDPKDVEISRLRQQVRALAAERDKMTADLQREIDQAKEENRKLSSEVISGRPRMRLSEPVAFDRSRPCWVELGRYGDIINILPILREIYLTTGLKPVVVISEEFKDMFDGIGYADPMPMKIRTVDVIPAIEEAKRKFNSVTVSQVFGVNYDPGKETAHYNMESWRLAGWLDRWADPSLRLVFDRRDVRRERRLIEQLWPESDKPVVLINCSSGHSSPFDGWGEFQKRMINRWSDQVSFVDLGQLKCERVYDMVGLMEVADLIVTIDTATLHLVAATTTPTIALLSYAGGWRMSEPRCRLALSFRSNEWRDHIDAFDQKMAQLLGTRRRIVHLSEEHPSNDQRSARARQTWKDLRWQTVRYGSYVRDARAIGDPRDLPFLRDVLEHGLRTACDDDILVFTNDDIIIHPDAGMEIRRLLGRTNMVTSRRIDVAGFPSLDHSPQKLAETDTHHYGRDLVAWRAGWLRQNLHQVPDFILGASEWDLWAAAWARKMVGIDWTMPASPHLCPTCELPPGLVLHEEHQSKWSEGEKTFPSQIHNRRLFKDWAAREAPQVFMPWFSEV